MIRIQFLNLLHNEAGIFNSDQQDAQEALSAVLDVLHTEMERSPSFAVSEGTVVNKCFRGNFDSFLGCFRGCELPPPTTDPFMLISIPIPETTSSNKYSIDDCFSLFSTNEHLSAENVLRCRSCGCHSVCMKQMLINSLPEVLVVHVKRFSETGEKRNDSIAFPLMGFNLSRYMSTSSRALYDCVAVCSHNGHTLSSGHYTTFSHRGGHWYHFDDGQPPKSVDEALIMSEAETRKVYLIFYVRRTK